MDIETLEKLEELLFIYPGTLLLVTHDRAFLDNVVTSTLVFEGKGKIQEYIGGYQDYLRQCKSNVPKKESVVIKNETKKKPDKVKQNKKLSYKEQNELEALPKIIEQLEHE